MKIGKLFSSFLIFALLLAVLPGQIQQVSAISPDIVISQVYGGGGNSGAQYMNDFVELFNRGTSTVSITGWSVQYASATGTGNFGGNPVTVINGSLAPGQYYLVQLAGGTNGVALPAADALGTANMSGASGKVIVSNQSAGLACNGGSTPCSPIDLAAIVDLVGYGGANFYEGSAAAPGLTNSTADFRAENGCTDTDNNTADFTAAAPNPRNTASPQLPCGVSGTPEVIITEIMYDPNSAEDNWEWIEIYNAGTASADLTGYVVDDFNSVALSSANIAGGTLAAGEQAILYNADDVSASDFAAAWGTVNLIPVTGWSALGLNNSGDRVSLWDSFASYSGDNVNHANAIDTVDYAGAGFPDPVGASIYLTNLGTDNNVGSNWATSTDGGTTPLFTGYTSVAAGGNLGTDVGSPGTPAVTSANVFINELRISGSPDAEYFELQGDAGTSLDGLAYVVLSGEFEPGQIDDVVDLTGYSIPADGFFVTANSTAASSYGITPDLSDSLSFFGSPTTHMIVSGFTGSAGADLDTNNDGTLDSTPWSSVVDSVSLIDGDGTTDYSYSTTIVGPDGSFTPAGTYRCDDAPAGTFDNNQLSFSPLTGTPGESNAFLCMLPVTKIHDVQGAGASSPLVGQTVAVEGIVVGDFQDDVGANGDLNGFFVQEEDADIDGDALTSEGIFVFQGSNPTVDVAIGDLVRVEGSVSEYFGDTEITSFSGVSVLSNANPLPTISILSLPVTAVDDFEAYEGMYVTFPQALVISEYFNFDRFGEIVLTSERHLTPTAEFEPGSPQAAQAAQDYLLDKITLDDGRTASNPDPAIHPNGNTFDLTNLFRGGDTVADVTGVINYDFGLYRVQPTQGADYTNANPRTAQHDDVGGNLKVSSFNVLNYFTSIDFIQDSPSNNDPADDICGPDANQECRGADDAEEFTRQRDKIVAAIAAIDADVVGLIEIENYPGDVPTADLVSGLNDVMGAGTYEYVETGALGIDAIRQAFIYKPATVSLVGEYAVLDDQSFTNPLGYVDDNGIPEEKSRPALAQTFMDNETGGVFTAVVNHLKSKGSSCGPGDDDPEAGSCNLTRKLGAQALVDWLATDPTGSGDEDFLIIGDLNSYDKEDPIDVLIAEGYADMVYQYQGEDAYSYVFDGQIGYLDHALANTALSNEITGVTIWHINADEPDAIDYDTTFKQDAQDAIYAPDAYRSSDHDPVIVGLDVCDEIAPTFDELSVSPDTLWPANHKYVDVTATVVVSDNFDPNPTVELVSVVSNEPDNGDDDGDTVNDIVIVDDFTFQLRAERSGVGTGRIYTITYRVTDACGNSTEQSVTVTVPLSQGD